MRMVSTYHLNSAPSYRILVAEDGKSAAEVISMFFEMEGLESAVAHDGIKAVELAETFRPHLICMDLAMPLMDGFEAARRIREKFENVIIVALCGGDESVRRHTEDEGFDHYLAKPVTPDDLRKMLERFLPARRNLALRR
jgi:CheY-like chemotaxis protein